MSPVPVNVALQGYEDVIESVIGHAEALSNVGGQLVGSIEEFQVGTAYYIKVTEYVDFQWGGISEPTTSSAESQQLQEIQRQLDRLGDDRTTPTQQSEKQILIDKILRKQRNG